MTYLESEFTTHGDDEDVVHDLKLCVVHHPIAGLLQHHGDGGQGGDADHYPVQVGHKAKQLVESLETHLAPLVGVQGILIMKSESSKCCKFLPHFTLIRNFTHNIFWSLECPYLQSGIVASINYGLANFSECRFSGHSK